MPKVNCRTSRFPRIEFLHMYRVFDHAESMNISLYRCPWCCLPYVRMTSALRILLFEAQYLTCTYHCRTLRVHPYGYPRMTHGRCVLLKLHRMALSSTTLCRFSSALSLTPLVIHYELLRKIETPGVHLGKSSKFQLEVVYTARGHKLRFSSSIKRHPLCQGASQM